MEVEDLEKFMDDLSAQIGKNIGYTFSKSYRENKLNDFFIDYGTEEVYKSFTIAQEIYFDANKPQESLDAMLNKIGGILYNRKHKPNTVKWENKK